MTKPGRPRRARHGLRLLVVVATIVAGLAVAPAAEAETVTGAAFSSDAGTYTGTGGTLYARQGAALTLTVATGPSRCVRVLGGAGTEVARDTSNRGETLWTFDDEPWLVAGAGDGLVSYTVLAYQEASCEPKTNQGKGDGETMVTRTASYVLDNTAPTATAGLSPAPNASGWNRSDVTVTWNATDNGGSGVASVVPATHQVTSEGVTTRTTSLTDRLGNTAASSPVTVRLDRTAPAVTGQATPAPNDAGWNNTPVTVTFTATDAVSGVRSSTGPVTLTTDGTDQSVTGTATDTADNVGQHTVGGIDIDTTAPSLTGAPTSEPNAAGWYRDDVTVAWDAHDGLSGTLDPDDSTITGEGTGLTATASVLDRAGNTSGSVQSQPAVRIDRTAPETTVSAPPAWSNHDLTLRLTASDGLSGVDATAWSLDGGPVQSGTEVEVSDEGSHTLEFWSTDRAGNTEPTRTVSFGIDKTSPTIGHVLSPAANADGWHNAPVTVTFTCSDAVSGVASCTEPRTVSTEGRDQPVTGTVEDNAGNRVHDPVSLDIDLTRPTITVDDLPPANGAGWYGAPVTVTFTAEDALSGIRSAERSVTFGEGAGQTATARATDLADNRAEVTTPPVDVDTTPPTITGRVLEEPHGHGWFRDDVTVRWGCDDTLSGVVECPGDSVLTGEGSALSASESVTDRAGHTATATVTGVRIDRTAPSTSVAGVPGGWADRPVTLTLTATDNLSDVRTTHYVVDGETEAVGDEVVVGTEGVHTVRFWSVDHAGNAEPPQTVTVRVDLSAPTVVVGRTPEANAQGWHNTDVAVSFSCEDQPDLSGLASCSDPVLVITEGRGQEVSGTAVDSAGNRATGTTTLNIDKTPPTVTGAPDRAANAAGWYDAPVTVSFEASDELSGIDLVTPPQHVGEGEDQTVEGSATDNAGNLAVTTVGDLDVDLTDPDLSAAPTSAPNEHGWYNTEVTQVWHATDTLSGLDGDAPAPSLISGEGRGQTVSETVRDRAGNTTTTTSEPVDVDLTAPTTAAAAPDGWVNHAVEVVLTPRDVLSGVDTTWFRVDGGARQEGTRLLLTDDGVHTVSYGSTDLAGNAEEARTVTVRVDRTAPTIRHTLDPEANRHGWHRTDVTVTFECADQEGLSGVATCTPPQQVTDEGLGQLVHGSVTDHAGNAADDVATVNLDRTPPRLTLTRSPEPNAEGWSNREVLVDVIAEDDLSGVDTVTPDVTVGEGADQSVTATATDAAGNETTATLDGLNVDLTPPGLVGTPVEEPNENGWYAGDVTIAWRTTDGLSGPAGDPPATTLTGEGRNLRATATTTDVAGNSTTADSAAVHIDRTPPTTGAEAPSGWSDGPVSLSLAAADGLSGVAATYHRVDDGPVHAGTTLTVAEEGQHVVRYWSVDLAGNVEPTRQLEVRVDLTAPVLTHSLDPAPNGRGWHRGPVTVGFACDDALSGVAVCPEDVTVDTDGRDQVVTGTATDRAGNSASERVTVHVDTADPTIAGAPDRAPNGNGWYDAAVTVGFTCDDALSGIVECADPLRLGEGAGQSARGEAVDAAGNRAVTTVEPLHVDTTAPTLRGGPASTPGRDGWYRDDVTVTWHAGDALSGLDGPAPADGLVTGEGRDLTLTETVVDLAGNRTTASSESVRIDRTPPRTAVSDVSEWSNEAVTVELTAADNLSGVAATYHQVDDGPETEGDRVVIGSEGEHTLRVWSEDVAGNIESRQTVQVRIDATAPTIDAEASPRANDRGWNNTRVTVSFRCGDDRSGVAACPDPVDVGEGGGQRVVGTVTDVAGNSASAEATVNVDLTPPTATGSLSASPNAHGWFDTEVVASFECADQAGLSGVVSCPAPVTLGEGRGQRASGHGVDAADNVGEDVWLTGIDVDLTRPDLTGALVDEPNDEGWFNGDVRVRWDAHDELSGVDGDGPGDSVVTGEGDALSASATVADLAGNTRTTTVTGIRIDRTAPTTSASAPEGWQGTPVTVRLTASDALSGVAATHWSLDDGEPQRGTEVVVADEGTHVVRYWSVDLAGNREPASSVTVLVDRSAPTITGHATTEPNAAGWYAGPVTVAFRCDDVVSGVASCQPDATVTAEGENSVTGTAVDHAGNRATATVSGIRIDTVAPAVTVGGVVDGASYVVGGVPAATVSATDATSGVAAPPTLQTVGGNASGVGTYTVTGRATDRAGNTGTTTVTYQVVYGFGATLFQQPVNDTAHQTGVATSVFNAGQTVPLKFQLRDASGQVVRTTVAPQWLIPVKGSSTTAAVNEAAYAETATVGGTYTWDGTRYQYNWKTAKSQAGSYWRVGVALDDGRTYYVNIGLR